MGSENTILSLSQQLSKTAERVGSFAVGIEDIKRVDRDLSETYEKMLYDEIAHVQVLVLELTRLISDESGDVPEETTDEAFMPGELNSVEGEKPEEKPEEKPAVL